MTVETAITAVKTVIRVSFIPIGYRLRAGAHRSVHLPADGVGASASIPPDWLAGTNAQTRPASGGMRELTRPARMAVRVTAS